MTHPGQYFDYESSLHYNYFRDYDPKTGRYIEPDPIGLDGGTNIYLYVSANPLKYADPLGLWTPGLHRSMSAEAADVAGCSNRAPEFGSRAAQVDFLSGSNRPENSHWHAMSNGESNQTFNDAQAAYDGYVAMYSSSCSIGDLGRALHAVQDSYSPSHRGFQPWRGRRTPFDEQIGHWLQDIWIDAGTRQAAVGASANIIAQAKARCPCLCKE